MKLVKNGKSSSLSERKVLRTKSTYSTITIYVSIVGGTGDRIKNDSGWKDNMSRIAEAHPRQSTCINMVRIYKGYKY